MVEHKTDDTDNVRPTRFLRKRDVTARIGVTGTTLYRWERDGKFPKRRKIGKQAIAWVEAEIDEWCANRPASSECGR